MDNFDPDAFADWIKKHKIKQYELAKQLGVDATSISRWIKRKSTPTSTRLPLINALMRGEDLTPPPSPGCIVPLRMSDELYEIASVMAAKRGKTVDAWVSESLQQFADELAAIFIARRGIAPRDKDGQDDGRELPQAAEGSKDERPAR